MRPFFTRILLLLLPAFFAGCAGTLTPSHQNPAAYTRFDAAVESCDRAQVRRMVDTDPALVNEKGWGQATPLYLAALNNCTEVAAFLIGKGADVNARGVEDATPLHIAAQKGNRELIRLLLSHGANANALDIQGRTPRDRAIQWGHPDAARILATR